jgi:hypothetical protein
LDNPEVAKSLGKRSEGSRQWYLADAPVTDVEQLLLAALSLRHLVCLADSALVASKRDSAETAHPTPRNSHTDEIHNREKEKGR